MIVFHIFLWLLDTDMASVSQTWDCSGTTGFEAFHCYWCVTIGSVLLMSSFMVCSHRTRVDVEPCSSSRLRTAFRHCSEAGSTRKGKKPLFWNRMRGSVQGYATSMQTTGTLFDRTDKSNDRCACTKEMIKAVRTCIRQRSSLNFIPP